MDKEPARYLRITVATQALDLIENGHIMKTYPVSTAKNGVGELNGSGCTPRGWHVIRAKIGAGLPIDTVFVARRPTGEIYDARLGAENPHRDWILSRILWLGGLEPGFNRFGNVDTASRYIYIHGSRDAGVTGQPLSHGCVRMKSPDVVELFDHVPAGLPVIIVE